MYPRAQNLRFYSEAYMLVVDQLHFHTSSLLFDSNHWHRKPFWNLSFRFSPIKNLKIAITVFLATPSDINRICKKCTWHCLNTHASTILHLHTSTRIVPRIRCVKSSWVILYFGEKNCLTQRMLTNGIILNIICLPVIVFVHLIVDKSSLEDKNISLMSIIFINTIIIILFKFAKITG